MDIGFEKERFETFKLKSSVAKKFRKFCKRFSKSQSITLLAMIDFFEINEVSPNERLGETISSIKSQMQKRFNAVIAIIRDIEKNQTKPTTAMLQRLFEEASNETEGVFDFGTSELISEHEELVHYRDNFTKSQGQLSSLLYEFNETFNKIVYMKGSFGKGYFKLEITREEYETLKQKINNVHNYNSTENR